MITDDHGFSRRALLTAGAVASGSLLLGAEPADAVTSDQITRAKRHLNEQSYWCGPANGTIDDLTKCAVLAYQKANGLPVDGILDYQIMLALNKPRTRPRFTRSGRVVEVDLRRQLLRVVSNGYVYLTLHASTGDGGGSQFGDRRVLDRTPKGKFRIRKGEDGIVTTSLGTQYHPHYFLGRYGIYGQSDLASVRRPSTSGGVAVHVRGLDLLAGYGHLARGRLVYVA